MSRDNPKLLVLIDMNGTLLLREKKLVPGKVPDFVHAKKNYYIRNGAKDFVKNIMSIPQIRFAFYTSMLGTNAKPAISKLAGIGWEEDGVQLYDRTYQKHDPSGKNKWDTMRDLEKVWKEEMTNNGYRFGPDNTLMIDDTKEKMREHPNNVLIVPELTAESLVSEAKDSSVLNDVYTYILDYILHLELSSKKLSVPDYRIRFLNDIDALSRDLSNTTLTE